MRHRKEYHRPIDYRIRLKGRLDSGWSEWFESMAISTAGNDTVLIGPVLDQASLHGLLIRIRDLNLTLISVERLGAHRAS